MNDSNSRASHYVDEGQVSAAVAEVQQAFQDFTVRFHRRLDEIVHELQLPHDADTCQVCE